MLRLTQRRRALHAPLVEPQPLACDQPRLQRSPSPCPRHSSHRCSNRRGSGIASCLACVGAHTVGRETWPMRRMRSATAEPSVVLSGRPPSALRQLHAHRTPTRTHRRASLLPQPQLRAHVREHHHPIHIAIRISFVVSAAASSPVRGLQQANSSLWPFSYCPGWGGEQTRPVRQGCPCYKCRL
jgi:hypothetical protein